MSYAREMSTDVFKLTMQNLDLLNHLETGDEDVHRKIRAVMEYNAPKV
jgi:hypothetical protein